MYIMAKHGQKCTFGDFNKKNGDFNEITFDFHPDYRSSCLLYADCMR